MKLKFFVKAFKGLLPTARGPLDMGRLRVGIIDLNDPDVVDNLIRLINEAVRNPVNYYRLRFKPPYYFEVVDGELPREKGWYIILDGKSPLYVGKADDLNKRLNTNHGTIDNFANKKRKYDSERNFIKKLVELGFISELRVCIIREDELCSKLNLSSGDLTDLDRSNIEKFIDVLRCRFNYL